MGVGGADDIISFQTSVSDLAADVSVRDTDDHAVLGSVVFVLVLDDETFAGIVVGLALSPPAELDLVPLEVSLVLNKLYKRHDASEMKHQILIFHNT